MPFLSSPLRTLRAVLPKRLENILISSYHSALAFLGAVFYAFPSRQLVVIGITGTKGKTTTAELVNRILEEAGHKTALSGTLRFKVGSESRQNYYKMTMPGRFFLQKFLRDAVNSGCTHAIIEMTSEGAAQHRHRHIDLNALVVTNIAPEHIESHGSYENYLDAKLSIARALAKSSKSNRVLVVNADDTETPKFIAAAAGVSTLTYSLKNAGTIKTTEGGSDFTFSEVSMHTPLRGQFNIANALAAATLAKHLGVDPQTIKQAVEKLSVIRGRMEEIYIEDTLPYLPADKSFSVIVDYAHTKDSLEAVYQSLGQKRKICVFGGTGGGRDRWKRPLMGGIAARYCAYILLTDEDPYDENPSTIVSEIKSGIDYGNKERAKRGEAPRRCDIIMDRREAIRMAVLTAEKDDVVIITGKGTDPFIMGPKGTKTPWSDAEVARDAIREKIKMNESKR